MCTFILQGWLQGWLQGYLSEKRTVCSCRALNTFPSVWEVFARSCKWISDLGNNMFVHSLGDSSVGGVQAQSGPAPQWAWRGQRQKTRGDGSIWRRQTSCRKIIQNMSGKDRFPHISQLLLFGRLLYQKWLTVCGPSWNWNGFAGTRGERINRCFMSRLWCGQTDGTDHLWLIWNSMWLVVLPCVAVCMKGTHCMWNILHATCCMRLIVSPATNWTSAGILATL